MVASRRVTIDWHPYEEASERPRFIVVSNRFSHAAHQLERLLDDPDVMAATAGYHCVRVDCDARPDVDVALQPFTGRAVPTWPLIALTSPDGAPRRVATHLSRRSLLDLLAAPLPLLAAPLPLPPGPTGTVDSALAAIAAAYDRHNGGFESPPKRPRGPLLELLLALPAGRAGFDGPPLALRTLDALAGGGIHDQLGGGFHLYSTDERWVVPHFEKRAADQASLLTTFARAAAATGQARYAAVVRRTIAYVEYALALPGGGYAASEDADVGAFDDGSHYTWSVAEARAALDDDELAVAQPYFDLYGRGELYSDPTRNVLFLAAPAEAVARELGREVSAVQQLAVRARDRLLVARAERPAPEVDTTAYAGVCAKMARAYLEAEAALGVWRERERALATLDRLYAARSEDGGIPHRLDDPQSLRWLADHAELGLASVRAYEATGERVHLDAARAMADHLLARFWHADGGFAAVPGGAARPFRDGDDGPGPSANAVAGMLLWTLATHAGDVRYAERARTLVDALLPLACGAPIEGAGLISLRVVVGIGQ